LTCKYKLPEINKILNYNSDKDILVQNSDSSSELIGFKCDKVAKILNNLNNIQETNLETKLNKLIDNRIFSSEKLPQYENIASYCKSNGDHIKYL